MSQGREKALDAASRFVELKARVDRAAKLIGELRETNYSLTAELASLYRKLQALEGEGEGGASDPQVAPSSSPAKPAPSSSQAEPGVHEELQALRDERKIIRAKVQSLLERIETLEL